MAIEQLNQELKQFIDALYVNLPKHRRSKEINKIKKDLEFCKENEEQFKNALIKKKLEYQDVIVNANNTDHHPTYPGGLSLEDFASLHQIETKENRSNNLYLYFDPNYIQGYNHINHVDSGRFKRLVQAGPLRISDGIQAGLKNINGNRISLNINGIPYQASINYELKIKGSEDRIDCFLLKPSDRKDAPDIIIAAKFIPGGHHKDHDKGYQNGVHKLPDLNIQAKQNDNTDAKLLSQNGFFSHTKPKPKASPVNPITKRGLSYAK